MICWTFHHRFPGAAGVLTLLLFLCGLPQAKGATLTLTPSADATLYEETATTTANGTGEFLLAGRTNQASNSRRHSLLQFDLSPLPAGAIITGASLQLHLIAVNTAETQISLHRVTQTWSAGAADPAGNESAGAAATIGDVTWQAARHPAVLWTTPGGDAETSASASVPVAASASEYTWSGPGVLADVTAWLDTPSSNFGWLLRDPETIPQTAKRFASSENPDPSLRPTLSIEFTVVPEPAALGLLAACGVLLPLPRRRP